MRILLLYIVLGYCFNYSFGQILEKNLINKKWSYYCDSLIVPSTVPNTLLLESSFSPSFYWEFREDGKFFWSHEVYDAKYDTLSYRIGGVFIVDPNYNWSLEKDILVIGDYKFIIDVLDENHLLIHIE